MLSESVGSSVSSDFLGFLRELMRVGYAVRLLSKNLDLKVDGLPETVVLPKVMQGHNEIWYEALYISDLNLLARKEHGDYAVYLEKYNYKLYWEDPRKIKLLHMSRNVKLTENLVRKLNTIANKIVGNEIFPYELSYIADVPREILKLYFREKNRHETVPAIFIISARNTIEVKKAYTMVKENVWYITTIRGKECEEKVRTWVLKKLEKTVREHWREIYKIMLTTLMLRRK